MLGIIIVGYHQVSESISWVKVISKWLQISPESIILKVFLTSHMLGIVTVGYDQVSEQGLKSIGNMGTPFPGREPFGRKEGAFLMKNQEDSWYFGP